MQRCDSDTKWLNNHAHEKKVPIIFLYITWKVGTRDLLELGGPRFSVSVTTVQTDFQSYYIQSQSPSISNSKS